MFSVPSVRPAFRTALIATVLFTGTVLLFHRAAGHGFVDYDDPGYVTANPHVQAGLGWAGVVWAFTAPTDYWHPLTWLSHMLDWQLYGSFAYGHHLSGILWHALNAVLVFLLFRRLGGSTALATFGAALFAWHPLRVESVAWVTERKDVMSGASFLLTLLAYLRYADRRAAGRPAFAAWLLTLAAFAAGLMSKPMLVTAPLVLLVLDFWPLHRLRTSRDAVSLVAEKLPFFGLSLVVAALTIVMQRHEGAFLLELSLPARAANALVSVARYLGKFLWPLDLAVFYPHPGHWPALLVLGAAALAVALTALAWSQRRARPWLLAGWLWFLAVLLPASGLMQVGFQALADRYTYLALLGIEVALLWSLAPVLTSPPRRTAAAFVGAALLAVCAARTWDQQGVWRDSITLFRQAVAVSPDNAIARGYLASALLERNQVDEAAPHAERAFALLPQHGPTLATLARLRERQQRPEDAAALYRRSLAADPADAVSHLQLGLLELNRDRPADAARELAAALRLDDSLQSHLLELSRTRLQRGDAPAALLLATAVLKISPDQPVAHYAAALAAAALDRPDDALAHYRAVVRLQPESVQAQAALGSLLLARGDAAGALPPLRAAIARLPGRADLQLALARGAVLLDRRDEAIAALARAVALAPADPGALMVVAELYARLGDYPAAAQHYRRLTALDPGNASAFAALGYMLQLSGDPAGAAAAWTQALALQPDFPHLRARLDAYRASR